MDNAPSLAMLLAVVIVGTIAAFLTSRYRPLLLVVVLAFVSVFFAIQYAQLLDPVIGPEVRTEAGTFYIFVSWSGLVFVFAGGVVGVVVRRSAGAKTR